MPFAAMWMELEIIILSEVSQTQKTKPYDITYMYNLKYDTNELLLKEKHTDIENRLVAAKWGRVGERWSGSLGLADAVNH